MTYTYILVYIYTYFDFNFINFILFYQFGFLNVTL